MAQKQTDLTAALAAVKPRQRGPRCTMGKILEKLETSDPKAHKALIELLDNEDIPATSIAEALNASGYQARAHVIVRHRRRSASAGCLCPK